MRVVGGVVCQRPTALLRAALEGLRLRSHVRGRMQYSLRTFRTNRLRRSLAHCSVDTPSEVYSIAFASPLHRAPRVSTRIPLAEAGSVASGVSCRVRVDPGYPLSNREFTPLYWVPRFPHSREFGRVHKHSSHSDGNQFVTPGSYCRRSVCQLFHKVALADFVAASVMTRHTAA